jgi:serine/threonine protein phosphatase PrpC
VSNLVRAYAAFSHRGNIKPYNEDRVSIVPKLCNDLPDISIFAVYDGHGGHGCAEYLREYMPMFIQK